MSFISFEFLILVALTTFIYYLPGIKRFQVPVLVMSSLVFYSWDQWSLLPLLILAIAVTYYSMKGAIHGSRISAALGIVANVFILFFFKYKFIFLSDVSRVDTGIAPLDFLLLLPLPLGISFFVFHNISLIVDYYKFGSSRAEPTPLEIILYILFFPQLVSGPIARAGNFIPQVEPKLLRNIPWAQISRLLITGLFFKLFCANNLAQFTLMMTPDFWGETGGGDKLFLLFVYSFQIYSDFFGYSLIAIGLALLFGYRLPVNFNLPYIASSFSNFWQRWHISLSQWIKTYLYIPLGGNRISPVRTYFNLLVVMTLGGLWHGAALSYAIWGFIHGLLLAFERLGFRCISHFKPINSFSCFFKVSYILFVFCCVSICWILFKFPSFVEATAYFQLILQAPLDFKNNSQWYLFSALYMFPILFQHLLNGKKIFLLKNKILDGFYWGALLWLAFAERGTDTPFIYFRF